MPISYLKDVNAWSLKDVTQEEADILAEIGKNSLLSMMGVGILQRMHERAEEAETLNSIPVEAMGPAQ